MQDRSAFRAAQSAASPRLWTPETEARALRLFLIEGLSAGEVAAALGAGVSRGAVLSKMRRLGFRKREVAAPRHDVLRAAPAAADCRRIERRLPPSHPPQPLPPLRDAPATGRPTTLAELFVHACRWPIDDPGPGRMHTALFCAGPADGHAYCPVHRELARRPPAPKSAP